MAQPHSDFYSTHLKFGTAGLRAKMGEGPDFMNLHTIQQVTQGIANYILTFPETKRVNGFVICHDCRNHSRQFAEETAKVLAGNGIRAHIVPALRPTPYCSYAIRSLKALGGVNITASHNRKEYNGYKVYWSDGAQVVPPHDEQIIAHVQDVTNPEEIRVADIDDPLISTIPEEIEDQYFTDIKTLRTTNKQDKLHGDALSIAYTPLHGAGNTMIPKALKSWGFSNLHIVKEQSVVDGDFPTAPYPNPEKDAALKLLWQTMQDNKCDIGLASDPDSDRLSLSITEAGEIIHFNGDELGELLLHFLIDKLEPEGKWAAIRSIVSSPLLDRITELSGGTAVRVLTGFKYIGEKIHQWETSGGPKFFFGMEQSLGYLHGTFARDKDAIVISCLVAEMALDAKLKQKSLREIQHDIYRQYGICRTGLDELTSDKGLSYLTDKMDDLRKNYPTSINGVNIIRIDDYEKKESINTQNNTSTPIDLPKADVLGFHLENGTEILLRPSGTEPKLKIYALLLERGYDNIPLGMQTLEHKMQKSLDFVKKWF